MATTSSATSSDSNTSDSSSSNSSDNSDVSTSDITAGRSTAKQETQPTELMQDIESAEGMTYTVSQIEDIMLATTDEDEETSKKFDNKEYVDSLLQDDEETQPEVNQERRRLKKQALQRRMTQEERTQRETRTPQDPRRHAQEREQEEKEKKEHTKATSTADLRTHASKIALKRPAGERPVTSIKVRYIQIEPLDPVPGYSVTRVYNINPPQPKAAVINKMRDNCHELEREAYANYMFRLHESGTKAVFTIRTQGILESKSTTITTMFESENAEGYVNTTEARLESSTVEETCDAKNRTRSIVAVVYYTGEFKKFPHADAAINRLQQLEKLHTATGRKPAEALARLLNNLPKEEEAREERKKILGPDEPQRQEEQRYRHHQEEEHHHRGEHHNREERSYRQTYYEPPARHARTPYDQRERRRY